MPVFYLKKSIPLLLLFLCSVMQATNTSAQDNLLLNGNFEDINTCTEYNSECGVEAWFYLSNVKVQMLANEDPSLYPYIGNNSFGLLFTWMGYKNFTPIVGTILPCHLQKDQRYIFRGLFKKPRLNPKLIFWPGVVLGENFYVPNRPFSSWMHPDSITHIQFSRKTEFYTFEYSFVATGNERYLTFGTYITEDTARTKTAFIGTQTVSIVLDNFQLQAADAAESDCSQYIEMKEAIYNYNFRHKEMDYSLFSKGDLKIVLNSPDSIRIAKLPLLPPVEKPVKTDTLKLGDVFFDFNKAKLKPEALAMLGNYFKAGETGNPIDSIYIEGHTDSVGTGTRNIELSRQRCDAVQNWIIQNGILSNGFIQIHPFGETRPVASNRTPQGRAQNRRVEMIIFRRVKKQ